MDDPVSPHTPLGARNVIEPLALGEQKLTLAQRGALAEKEFAQLEAARKKAQSRPPSGSPPARTASRTGSPSHRTPRSAFDSRLAESMMSQRSSRAGVQIPSHRTPRERAPTLMTGANDIHSQDLERLKVIQYGGMRGLPRRTIGPF